MKTASKIALAVAGGLLHTAALAQPINYLVVRKPKANAFPIVGQWADMGCSASNGKQKKIEQVSNPRLLQFRDDGIFINTRLDGDSSSILTAEWTRVATSNHVRVTNNKLNGLSSRNNTFNVNVVNDAALVLYFESDFECRYRHFKRVNAKQQ